MIMQKVVWKREKVDLSAGKRKFRKREGKSPASKPTFHLTHKVLLNNK
jgi:hypothetical protein